MDVTCERCGTEYEFDETLVAPRGTTVKCTQCGHLFKVFRPGAGPGSEPRAWMVRRATGGAPETIGSLKELQRRITVGELTPEDQISRSGEGWKRLGDIAELQTFFEAARAAGGSARRDPTVSYGDRAADRGGGVSFPSPPAGPRSDRRGFAPAGEAMRDAPDRTPPPAAPPGKPTGKSTMLGVGARPPSPVFATEDDGRPGIPRSAVEPPPNEGSGVSARPGAGRSDTSPVALGGPAGHVGPVGLGGPRSTPPPAPPRRPQSSSPGPPSPPPRPPSPRPPPLAGGARPGALPAPPRVPREAETLPEVAPPPGAPSAPAPSDRPPSRRTSERPSFRPLHVDEGDDIPKPRYGRSRSGLWVSLVLLLAIGAGALAGWDQIAVLLGAGGERGDPAAPFLASGDEQLRGDHEDAYEAAIAHYTKALAFREHDPRALAGLSRAHALIAQERLFEASDLEARAGDDPALRGEAASMRRDARAHAEQAREHAEAAVRHAPADADAEVALSDALRLSGDLALARSRLDRARTLRSTPSAEALRVEALLTADQAGDFAAAQALAERAVAEDPGLLRARLLLARAHIAAGDVSAARAQLRAVIDRAPGHPTASALLRRLDGDVPAGTATARAAAVRTPTPAAAIPAPRGAPTPTPTVATPAPTPTSPAPIPATGTTTVGTGRAGPTGAAGATSVARDPAPVATGRGYDAMIREAEERLENGDTRRARSLYEQALRERPGGVEATTGLGFVMLAEGNARGAITLFQGAADRGYADAYIGLGDAYRRTGDRERALQAYEAYLERNPGGSRASIARRQADRLRTELGRSESGGGWGGGSGSIGSDTPVTRPDELPALRGLTSPPPRDIPGDAPVIESEP
jgi:predicted Zn finger-like uncharacterized protein